MPGPKRASGWRLEGFSELEALVVDGAEDLFNLEGEFGGFVDELEGLVGGDGSADLGEVEC